MITGESSIGLVLTNTDSAFSPIPCSFTISQTVNYRKHKQICRS